MQSEVTLAQRQRLADNLAQVRERISTAANRAGRRPEEIKLIAVTKYVGPKLAHALYDLGCTDLGESRPQELFAKAEILGNSAIRWHLIGHLQRNKIRRTLPLVQLIHAADRQSLLGYLDAEAAQYGQPVSILLEVNISADPAKHGFAPAELPTVIDQLPSLPHLRVKGLMGMSGLESDDRESRRQFALLRDLRDQCRAAFAEEQGELSMGMSGDFEIAIEEGATMVRVGSALFAGLDND
jgi:PLP dependent protein